MQIVYNYFKEGESMLSQLIVKKAKAEELTSEEFYLIVDYLMKNGVNEEVKKLFLALNSFGLTKKEVLYFASAVRDSGRVLKFTETVFEKHSTGGIGDGSSIALIPLMASLGYKIVKTTGRSLVYCNGSSDRFNAIPGFVDHLTHDEVDHCLEDNGACVLSHSDDVCPADKLLYDVMETCGLEDDINLLAVSILAKKLASGAHVVLVDVKYGDASIIKTYSEAKKLAKLLKYCFNKFEVKNIIFITNTLQTFGEAIGNAVEVVDALKVLQGRNCFLRKIVCKFAKEMIMKVNKRINKYEIYDLINASIDCGNAYRTFMGLVKNQGGNVKLVEEGKIFRPYKSVNFKADKNGYVGSINSLVLGEIVRRLCQDTHDNNIGIVLRAKIGDYVHAGDVLVTFYYKNKQDLKQYEQAIAGCIRLTSHKVKKIRVVKKVMH